MDTNNSLKSRKPSITVHPQTGHTRILWRGSEIYVSESMVTVDDDIRNLVLYKFDDNMTQLNVFLLSPKRRSVRCLQRTDTWRADSTPSYRWDEFGPYPLSRNWTSVSESQAEEDSNV